MNTTVLTPILPPVSTVGYGCAGLGGQYGPLEEAEGIRAVHQAIDMGVNFFDTSAYYGETVSETRLGKALKGRRNDVILATKGGRHKMDSFDYSYDSIIKMCDESLARLQTDWLDVYQLHDIEFGRMPHLIEGVRALQDLKQQGKVRAIGVTAYPLSLLRHMAEAHDLDVTIAYCHANLMNNQMDSDLVPTVKARGMGLINASITHMGILTPQGGPDWHPAPDDIKQAGRAAATLCTERGANLAELAIQYALQNAQADVTLLGTRTVAELESSLALINKPIDADLLTDVQAIIAPIHNRTWESGFPEYTNL